MKTKEKIAYCEICDNKIPYIVRHENNTRIIKDKKITLEVDVPHCSVCDHELYVIEISHPVQLLFFDAYKRLIDDSNDKPV